MGLVGVPTHRYLRLLSYKASFMGKKVFYGKALVSGNAERL
jgi:hypothetical protein